MKYYGIGRRKSAVAKVSIINRNTKMEMNTIIINNKTISDYFQNDKDALESIRQFLTLDIPLNTRIQVSGGGITAQKEAICLALAKALAAKLGRPACVASASDPMSTDQMGFSNILKKKILQKNLFTQDSRVKERKKYGLKKARKAPQYSKR